MVLLSAREVRELVTQKNQLRAFPGAVIMKDHELGGLKQRYCLHSELKVSAGLCSCSVWERLPLCSSSSGLRCSLVRSCIAEISASISTWPSSLCAYVSLCLHTAFSVCLCPTNFFLLKRTLVRLA